MKKLGALLRNPNLHRAAIALYVVCVVGVVGAYMGVSTLDVRHSVYFQGASVLQSGQPNAMRGVFMNAQTGEFLGQSEIKLTLLEASEGTPERRTAALGSGHARSGGLVHLQIEAPPDWPAGKHELLVEAQNAASGEFVVRREVELAHGLSREQSAWPARTPRAEPQKKAAPRRRKAGADGEASAPEEPPAIRVDVLPGDNELVRGLMNTIYIRTTDAKTQRPLPARVRFKEVKGIVQDTLPGELRTDRLGLARLQFVPVTDQVWKLEVEQIAARGAAPAEAPIKVEADVRLSTVAAQFSLQLKEHVAVPGTQIEGVVYSLFESGGYFVDLYEQQRWLDAAAFGLSPGSSGLRVAVPRQPGASGIYRVQVYQSFYNPANAWDVAYVAHARDTSTDALREAAAHVLGFIAEHTEGVDPYFVTVQGEQALIGATHAELSRWLEAFLLAIPRHFVQPPALINTQQQDRTSLELWKVEVKRGLKLLAILIFVIGMAVVLYFVLQGILRARAQSRLLREVDFELDGFDDADYAGREQAARLEQIAVALQGFIVLMSVALFGLGILMLLNYL
ncbi:MAG: hypothetical protein H0U74_14205 [Bradymonadaceae bacterium]|nr:hypothetical protein [Lujinxingiaceae bacterium]